MIEILNIRIIPEEYMPADVVLVVVDKENCKTIKEQLEKSFKVRNVKSGVKDDK